MVGHKSLCCSLTHQDEKGMTVVTYGIALLLLFCQVAIFQFPGFFPWDFLPFHISVFPHESSIY